MLVLLTSLATLAPARSSDADFAALAPASTVLYVETVGLAALLAHRADADFPRALSATPLAEAIEASLDDEARTNLALLAEFFDGSTADGIAGLVEHGAALSIGWKRARPTVLVMAHARDAAWLGTTIDRAIAAVAKKYGVDAQAFAPVDEDDDARIWRFGPVEMAEHDGFLLFANEGQLVDEALAVLRGEARKDALCAQPGFLAARAARTGKPGDALLWSWLDVARVRDLAERVSKEKEGARPFAGLLALERDPSAHFVLGPALARLATAEVWTFEVRTQGTQLDLGFHADGVDLPEALIAAGEALLLPSAAQPGEECANLLLYRDAAALYARRAALFPPEVAPEMATKLAELSVLFGGQDLGDEVFPKIGPWIRVVVRPARFAPGLKPEIELPAAAFVLELKDPERTGPELVSAFQTTIGIVSAQRAQAKQPPLLLTIEKEGDISVSVGKPLAPKPGDGVDVGYNLVPACVAWQNRLVIGTHASLVHEVVRDLATTTQPAGHGAREHLALRGGAIARYLEENEAMLVAQNMLEKGHTSDEARREIGVLIALTRSVDRLEVELWMPTKTTLDLSARLTLQAAASRTGEGK